MDATKFFSRTTQGLESYCKLLEHSQYVIIFIFYNLLANENILTQTFATPAYCISQLHKSKFTSQKHGFLVCLLLIMHI